MIIDAHQHFWRLDRGDYGFPPPSDPVLFRDFLPADFEPALAGAGVGASIAVQATETVAETQFLLDLAAKHPAIAGIVGWCDLADPAVEAQIDRFLGLGPLVGLRPMLQKADDASWLLAGSARDALASLADRRLVFEALIDMRHLPIIGRLADEHPNLRIVVDHMAKPWRHPDRLEDWQVGMAALARRDNCMVKISGYPFGASLPFPALAYAGLIGAVQRWFGLERMIWGSDWPVLLRGTDYRSSLKAAQEALPDSDQITIFSDNAIAAFGLNLRQRADGCRS